jgi:LmbE family N-acetylglucosaminyl deacetylase
MSWATGPLILMAVLAHPDDESTSVGGVLARYAMAGVRTVLVTCTGGEMGDGPRGVKPGQPGHDPRQVAATRRAELAEACAHLGVASTERLGYRDSGANQRPELPAFCAVPIADAATRLAVLVRRHRPHVVVTHDPDAGSQHPDHIRAGVVTTQALRTAGSTARVYYKAHGTGHWARLRESLQRIGIDLPTPTDDVAAALAGVEQRITTTVDVRAVIDRKHAALHAHASQINSSLAGRLPLDQFRYAFGTEEFIRPDIPASVRIPERGLFDGR